MSCNNFGNIVGMQLAALLTSFVGDQWQYLMFTVSALALLFAFLIFFFVQPDPKEIGIQIEDLDENEMLIEAAMDDKEVYSKMVEVERKSIRLSTKEVVDEVKHSQTYKRIRLSVRGQAEYQGNISFFRAWFLPGVLLYSSAYFCTKMAVY